MKQIHRTEFSRRYRHHISSIT